MLQITQIKLEANQSEETLPVKIAKLLHIKVEEILSYRIVKRSIDSRKKPLIFYIYTVWFEVANEDAIWKKNSKLKHNQVSFVQEAVYQIPYIDSSALNRLSGVESVHRSIHQVSNHRATVNSNHVVIVGSGPAGLFSAYILAKAGVKPIIIERGAPVEQRQIDVQEFWDTGILNTESNVQFGEGGAGTFSDGKLNTQINDKSGRNQYLLQVLVDHGAPKSILYDQKPHVGTDVLIQVVRSLRTSIQAMGGEFYFHSRLIDLTTKDSNPKQLDQILVHDRTHVYNNKNNPNFNPEVEDGGTLRRIRVSHLVLAIGHSARDTFRMLHEVGVPMESKPYAVGFRVEHNQSTINQSQYGTHPYDSLPPAAYKLTTRVKDERGVYTFCMCPGGYVVNASSEQNRLVVNGMSYHKRDGQNANSAVIVTVDSSDFMTWGIKEQNALSGLQFQEILEERAYQLCKGKIPVQRFEDFCHNQVSTSLGEVTPQTKGQWQLSRLNELLPDALNTAIQQGMIQMDQKLRGFAHPDTLLLGVESRTSSPIRILRDESFQSEIRGIYPCGEGAGYAGGITSAAMDGMKVAEAICKQLSVMV